MEEHDGEVDQEKEAVAFLEVFHDRNQVPSTSQKLIRVIWEKNALRQSTVICREVVEVELLDSKKELKAKLGSEDVAQDQDEKTGGRSYSWVQALLLLNHARSKDQSANVIHDKTDQWQK